MTESDNIRVPVSQQPHSVTKSKKENGIGGLVSVQINEKAVMVPLGTTILEACRKNQIHIPTLCHHEDLCLAGLCRICVVDVEGMKTLQAACSFPITSPLKIHTSTPMVRKARSRQK